MFEPIIIEIAFLSFILSAFKNAIIIAVTADDDCVMNVIIIPIKNDIYMFDELLRMLND